MSDIQKFVERRRKEAAERKGHCYELALQFIKTIEEDEGELVHGTIYVPKTRTRIHHAWIELKTGYTYEPVENTILKTADFYKVFIPKDQKRYKPTEAIIKAVKSRHYGPWE